jgi:hypothetical protein
MTQNDGGGRTRNRPRTGEHRPRHSIGLALLAVLAASAPPASAQQSPGRTDSVQAQLRTTLRAFYFSLAHQDWEALAAHILPAKVVAHHPAPEAMVVAGRLPASPAGPIASAPAAGTPPERSTDAHALVEEGVITLDGDWAEVSVPRCASTLVGADEFRFVRFEGRWWIVYIALASAGAPPTARTPPSGAPAADRPRARCPS